MELQGRSAAKPVRVVVDTSVWSLALRRSRKVLSPAERAAIRDLDELINAGDVILLGAIRQEILTGIRDDISWERLRAHLRHFEDAPVSADDYEDASRCANHCAARGLASTDIDMLLCAYGRLRSVAIFTTDPDFLRYVPVLGIRLHKSVRKPRE